MNNKGDPGKEVRKIIKDCMATLSKLHMFFYNSDNIPSRKVQIFNMVIRSKLMYGLETIVMNEPVEKSLNIFQITCIRKILKLPTTYIHKEFSNIVVRDQINKQLAEAKAKPMEPLSMFHRKSRITYLCKLIYAGTDEPGTAVTFDPITYLPLDHGKKRVGQPRKNWYNVTLNDLWVEAKKVIDNLEYASEFGFLRRASYSSTRSIREDTLNN